jgi:polysaccharide biosynthesis transport protein
MNSHNELQSNDSSAHGLLLALRRRWPVVLLLVLLTPGIAIALSLSKEKQYEASASLLFRDPQLDQKLFGATVFAPSNDPAREAATNVKLVSLEVVSARTSRKLAGRLTPDEIQSKIQVKPEGQSDVASITATDPDPRFAALLANQFAQEFIAFRRDADRSKIASAQQLVQAQLKAGPGENANADQLKSLRTQAEQLQILAALQTGNAELVQRAQIPTSPATPRPVRDGFVGLIVGILLAIAAAVGLEAVDRRLRNPREIGAAFGRPVLGAIPESRSIGRTARERQPFERKALDTAEAEAFRMLRANLRYFNIDEEIKSVLITSAAPGDGKSTVALHLARTAAESGSRVLLLEADLRRPSLGKQIGMTRPAGLSQVLSGSLDLADAVRHVQVGKEDGDGERRVLDVLLSGQTPPNPSDLIESTRMRSLIGAAEGSYDLVVIDTPPTSLVSDAIPLITQVTGVIVVTRLGRTTRQQAEHLRLQLESLNANTLGVVVNAVGRRAGYGYGYGYGYTTPADKPRRAAKRKTAVETTVDASDPESERRAKALARTAAERSRDAAAPANGNGNGNGHENGTAARPRAGSRSGRSQGKTMRGRLARFFND